MENIKVLSKNEELKDTIDILEIAMAEIEWEYPMNYAAAIEMAIKYLRRMAEIEEAIKTLPGVKQYHNLGVRYNQNFVNRNQVLKLFEVNDSN